MLAGNVSAPSKVFLACIRYRNLYRLLLREPREMSKMHQLQLTAAPTEQQLQKAYATRSSSGGKWRGISAWQTFAGVNWQLACSFVPSASQRHQCWHLAVGVRFSVSGDFFSLLCPCTRQQQTQCKNDAVAARHHLHMQACWHVPGLRSIKECDTST